MRDSKRVSSPYRRDRYTSKPDTRSKSIHTMYKAICDNCGRNCEVPFKPSNGKPVYCSDCFEKKENAGEHNKRNDSRTIQDQLDAMNQKLDTLLRLSHP